MDKNFQSKKSRVLVVEGSGATRTLITETVRKLGFTDITGVPTAKDAFQQLEADKFDWILTSTYRDQSVNAFHVMRLIVEDYALRGTRISLMIDDDEKCFLPLAFKLGLLSFHFKPFTKDTLTEQLDKLVKSHDAESYRTPLVAGSYLRNALTDLKMDAELLRFEKALLKQYPSDRNLLLNLVPPMTRCNQVDKARSVLRQVKMLDPSLEKTVKSYADTYTGGSIEGAGAGDSVNILSLKSAVIVEPEKSFQQVYKDVFNDLGFQDYKIFEDGESAASHIKSNPNPDLVIMEWRLPRLPGPLFIQRIKSEGAASSPIVVVSELLEKDDHPLVKEMGVATVIEKPCEKRNILESLILTVQQDRMPTEQGSMERKMRELLKSKKFADALAIKNKFVQESSIDNGAKETISAEFAYAQKNYEQARDHGIEAIKLAGDSLFTLNLLGKCLIQLRDFETALRCFKKAQSMSPKNVERLCLIAEAHSENGDTEQADAALNAAKGMDSGNKGVAESEVKLAINSGNTSKAKALMGQIDAIENIVSYMNNSAVAMARCDMLEQSLEQYRKTLKSIPDENEETKSVVMYNLALAHVRANELEEAKIHLERCTKLKSRVKEKAQNLLKNVKKALEKGVELNISKSAFPPQPALSSPSSAEKPAEAPSTESTQDVQNTDLLATVSSGPGDIGLFLIFRPEKIDASAEALLANMPVYRRREKIERDESRGADRILAAS